LARGKCTFYFLNGGDGGSYCELRPCLSEDVRKPFFQKRTQFISFRNFAFPLPKNPVRLRIAFLIRAIFNELAGIRPRPN
jgi:hypothetical protein